MGLSPDCQLAGIESGVGLEADKWQSGQGLGSSEMRPLLPFPPRSQLCSLVMVSES